MTTHNMLRDLGYTTASSGIKAFQRDYNRVGSRPLLVTGELDATTTAAVELAHSTSEMFKAMRDQGKG
ncbi:hypothetical protein [Enhygromyxa salina]|uniref:Uncharacterized protein n=1 Tax=Enhygromyxa salina TaxID=215803 RepID=A0A2S9YAA9_9BACT|nr:hypothetical protein [Enhygromyxa salina]PRQ02050.1 hypothetical protein ENSA7_56230 [Enhygromyxa salina]